MLYYPHEHLRLEPVARRHLLPSPLSESEVIRIVNVALSPAKMHTTKEKLRKTTMTKDILTECNVNRYLYPSRYNDEKEMLIA